MSFSCFKCVLFHLFQSKTLTICVLTGILFLSTQAFEISGADVLDTTFGSGGRVFTPFEGQNVDERSQMALQADGKIVVSGSVRTGFTTRRICLLRYNSNGTLDTSFGNGGKIITDLPRTEDYSSAIAVQPDGKIVVAGYTADVGSKLTVYDLAVLRYNTNGSPDTGFGIGGVKIMDFQNFEFFNDMVIQPDGKIVAAGRIGTDAGVVRLNIDGSLDNSFHQDGVAATPFPEFQSYVVNNVALTPDGKIVISGTESFKTWFMVRHNADGSLDTSFDGDGKVTTAIAPTGARDSDLILQSDGKAIIAGHTQPAINANKSNITLARYNPNGSLDTSFDGDGIVIKHPGDPNLNDEGADIALQGDGKIVVLGNLNKVPFSGTPHALWAILRFNTDGSLDTSFDGDGVATAAASGTEDIASALFIQPDGKFLVSGKTGNPSVFAVLRFNAPTNSPFDFDRDGKTDIGIYRPSNGSWWINSSSTNLTLAVAFGESTDKIVPADYTGDGKTDMALFRPSTGAWFVLRSEDYSYYGFPFGISEDVPAPGDFDGDGKIDAAVFRPSTSAWYILQSSDGAVRSLQFGLPEDKPVVADYDGDGKSDIAIFRPVQARWWILKSTGGIIAVQFGQDGDKTIQGDYTGDGKTDIAVWRPSNNFWYILRSEDTSVYGFPFGLSTDTPTPGDYDGDGKMDAAVFRDSNYNWYLLRSTSGFDIVHFGASGDKPLPNSYVR